MLAVLWLSSCSARKNWVVLAESWFDSGEYQAIETISNEKLKDDPSDSDAHYLIGRAFYSQGRFQEATETLSRSVSLDPLLARNHYWLGLNYLADGQIALADQQAKAVLTMKPNHPDNLLLLAKIKLEQADIGAAMALVSQVLSTNPQSNEAKVLRLQMLYTFYSQLHEVPAIVEELLDIIQKEPENHEARLLASRIFLDRGLPQNVLRWLNPGQLETAGLNLRQRITETLADTYFLLGSSADLKVLLEKAGSLRSEVQLRLALLNGEFASVLELTSSEADLSDGFPALARFLALKALDNRAEMDNFVLRRKLSTSVYFPADIEILDYLIRQFRINEAIALAKKLKTLLSSSYRLKIAEAQIQLIQRNISQAHASIAELVKQNPDNQTVAHLSLLKEAFEGNFDKIASASSSENASSFSQLLIYSLPFGRESENRHNNLSLLESLSAQEKLVAEAYENFLLRNFAETDQLLTSIQEINSPTLVSFAHYLLFLSRLYSQSSEKALPMIEALVSKWPSEPLFRAEYAIYMLSEGKPQRLRQFFTNNPNTELNASPASGTSAETPIFRYSSQLQDLDFKAQNDTAHALWAIWLNFLLSKI